MFELILIGALVALGAGLLRFRKEISSLQERVQNLEVHISRLEIPPKVQTAPSGKQAAQAGEDRVEAARIPSPWDKVAHSPETGERAPSEPPIRQDRPQKDARPVPATEDASPPKSVVFTQENLAKVQAWLKENWFYAIAALCLALAGVFFVQYGIENGLLTPFWRVIGALSLGSALVAAGEWVRRHAGDDEDQHAAFLPSTLSGAGLVALFAGVLAARHLYGLIGAEVCFAGLVAISLMSVVLGWFYGPFLTMVGVLGATATPFLVGGSSDAPQLFYYYFLLVALSALCIDTVKRWAWPSTLALILTFASSAFLYLQGAGTVEFLLFALLGAAGAIAIPVRRLWPDHAGTMVLQAGRKLAAMDPGAPAEAKSRSLPWPEFPTRLGFGAGFAALICSLWVGIAETGAAEFWLAVSALSLIYLAGVFWLRNAQALNDLLPFAPLFVLIVVMMQALNSGATYLAFVAGVERLPEVSADRSVYVLVALGGVGSVLGFLRAGQGGPLALYWTLVAAVLAPATVVTLELFWMPALVYGGYTWALIVLAVAALMVLFAERIARVATNRLQIALFAVSALTLVSLALMLLLTEAALTLALALMVLLAAGVDRRYDLALLSLFVQLGVAVVSWRLLVDPGIFWAYDVAGFWEMVLAFAGVLLLLSGAWYSLQPRQRLGALAALEAAIWILGGSFASLVLIRILNFEVDLWMVALLALVWLSAAAGQYYRLRHSVGLIRGVRILLIALFTLLGGGLLALVTVFNPLTGWERVHGPLVFSSLFVSYGLVAVFFAVLAWRFPHAPRRLRQLFTVLASLYAAFYVGLEIRHFWRGDDLSVFGTTDPELYSYTVALLLSSVCLLFFAYGRRSDGLYRIAIAGVGLTIAKVFLLDMAGLAGLIRVASFLGLGLALAGLAWINKQMRQKWERPAEPG